MNRRNAEPLDTETTIDMEIVSQKSVEYWLKKFKVWDGTSKKSLLDKVLLLESFFARVFDPVHFDSFPGLAKQSTLCEDGGEEQPGCGAEFHAWMRCCPFCTHSESEEHDLKTDDEVAEYLIKVEATRVRGPGKAPPAAIPTKPEPAPKPAALAPVVQITAAKTKREPVEEPVVDAIAPQTNGPIATVEELDAAIQRAISTYAAAATNAYECAVELREIHDRQLWRQRRGSDGQPKYKHFNNFVEAEFAPQGITRVRAYGLIDMAKKFSRDEFAKLGPAKMNVIVSMEEGSRQQLAKETIECELPLAEVRERKSQLQAAAPNSVKTSPKPALARTSGRSAEPTPEKDQSFTMVFPSSTFSVDCMASKGDQKKQKLARSVDDLPVGEVKGVNGMKLRVAVSQAKDGRIQVTGFLIREG